MTPEKRIQGRIQASTDNIWKAGRRLAMAKNILVVSASQTEKGTFGKDIAEGSASEDIRKNII